jgi:hypothetical protein
MLDATIHASASSKVRRRDTEAVLAVDATRVLTALCAASRGHAAGSPLALRRIASGVLGDTQRAADILAALDLAGHVRTDTMGWYSGWVTDSGLRAIPIAQEDPQLRGRDDPPPSAVSTTR